ncbi:MAG: phosphate acetyltransferase [Puniceicoccales bacterium]|nr:phosphate acetyltransferase [Puniceicoccales bacterium]
MSLINRLSVRLQNHPKRVVFPEGADVRILQAARQYATRRLGTPILVGNRSRIKINAARLNIKLEGIRIVEPERSEDFPGYLVKFRGHQRFSGLDEHEAADYLRNPNYFAAMMVATGGADAIVAGAMTNPASGLRAIMQILPRQAGIQTISSMQVLEMAEDSKFGANGTLFLSDCAIVPEPSAAQLCDIATTTAMLARHLLNDTPRVALLAYCTKSSTTKSSSIDRVKAATAATRERIKQLGVPVEVDGELQVDVAIDPFSAATKGVESSVAGMANVLIFPDLNSANIASKMVQVLAGIPAYGQIISGLERPAAEVSRSSSAHDIFGTAVITAAQAVERRFLHPFHADEPAPDTPPKRSAVPPS